MVHFWDELHFARAHCGSFANSDQFHLNSLHSLHPVSKSKARTFQIRLATTMRGVVCRDSSCKGQDNRETD